MRRRAEADATLAQVVQEHGEDYASHIADAYAYRGEGEQAASSLEPAYRQKGTVLYAIKSDLLLKHLTADARYKAFLRKMTLPE